MVCWSLFPKWLTISKINICYLTSTFGFGCNQCRGLFCAQWGSSVGCGLMGGIGVYITRHIAGQGREENLPSLSKDHFVVTDSFWHCSPRAGILRELVKKKKKKRNRSIECQRRKGEWRKGGKKGSKTCVQELNQWLEHSHLTTGAHTVEQCFRQ